MNLGSFKILLPFFRTSWGVGVLNSAIFKLIRMLEWNTKHFPLNLQSGLTFVKLSGCRGCGFELRNLIRHCKTVCIKRNLYLINYNRMRTQWTTKENRDADSSCSCARGLRRYLRNFGGGWTPQTPPSRYATAICGSDTICGSNCSKSWLFKLVTDVVIKLFLTNYGFVWQQ